MTDSVQAGEFTKALLLEDKEMSERPKGYGITVNGRRETCRYGTRCCRLPSVPRYAAGEFEPYELIRG